MDCDTVEGYHTVSCSMDYFGTDTPWYGGWCRGRQSINCQMRRAEGFCRCVIAELPQCCQKEGCGRKINEGDCIAKTGDGWCHVDCECNDSSSNRRKRRRRRGQHEKEVQQPRLNQNNSLDAILDAIKNYRSPSQSIARTPVPRSSTIQVPTDGKKSEEKGDQARRRMLVGMPKNPANMEKQGKDRELYSGPSSELTSIVHSLPLVTPQSDKKRQREDDTVKPSRANRTLRFETNGMESYNRRKAT